MPVARLCVGVLEEMGAWEHPGEPLVAEGPGSHLGPSPVLGGLGAGLGQSWGHLGASLGLSWGHPVSYWASFWEILVCPAGVLEALLGEVLGRSWGILPSSGRPGNLWVASCLGGEGFPAAVSRTSAGGVSRGEVSQREGLTPPRQI